jgi:hypothetical protein
MPYISPVLRSVRLPADASFCAAFGVQVLAVGVAFIVRGRRGGRVGSGMAQGALFTEAADPKKA